MRCTFLFVVLTATVLGQSPPAATVENSSATVLSKRWQRNSVLAMSCWKPLGESLKCC